MRGSILYRNGSWEISIYIPVSCRDSGPLTVRKFEGRQFDCFVPFPAELSEMERREYVRQHSNDWRRKCQGYREAERCLTFINTDIEKRSFRRDRYLGPGIVDTIGFLYEWLESQSLTPAGMKTYKAHIKNQLEPFFKANPFHLNQIELDTINKLLRWMQEKGLSPKYIFNCIGTLHTAMDYAKRCNRIDKMPSFPKKGDFKLSERTVKWLTVEQRQAVLDAIPEEHKPIFYWLALHFRRPGEAYALNREDYDETTDCFIIRRSTPARTIIDRTKTGAVHIVPMSSDFKPFMAMCRRGFGSFISPALFTCPSARNKEKRYTDTICHRLWFSACDKAGVPRIKMYHGTKHSSCIHALTGENPISPEQLRDMTDHARQDSIKPYVKAAMLERKRAIMNRNVIEIKERKNGS